MKLVWDRWHGVWVFVVPLFFAAVAACVILTRLRPSHDFRRSLAEVGMIVGTAPWIWMIFMPVNLPPGSRTVYLIPFTDLHNEFAKGDPQFVFMQVGGNLLVLFALGFFARMRIGNAANPLRLMVFGFAFALMLELLQHAFTGGRVFSVDDVLLNGLGCGLGALISQWAFSARQS